MNRPAPLPSAQPSDANSETASGTLVAVCIVSYNAADDLPACLAAVAELRHRPLELVVVDCASADRSLDVARSTTFADIETRILALDDNLGFAGGMNVAVGATEAPWVLALNADALPRPGFVSRLLERGQQLHRAAALTGRLVRPLDADGSRRLDACGMVLHPAWRHFDRGSDELDQGQYDQTERVFGATGAATLYRREALEDVAFEDDSIFDQWFHSYREDAELCFRFQERGWQVIYEPLAVAEHRRRVLPAGRRQLPAAINYHSFKNRYLLRAYHQTSSNFWHTLPHTAIRDVLAMLWVLAVERSSLAAYGWLWRHRRQIRRRRCFLANRRLDPGAVDGWFGRQAEPIEGPSGRP